MDTIGSVFPDGNQDLFGIDEDGHIDYEQYSSQHMAGMADYPGGKMGIAKRQVYSEEQPMLFSHLHPFSRFFDKKDLVIASQSTAKPILEHHIARGSAVVIASEKIDVSDESFEEKLLDILKNHPIKNITLIFQDKAHPLITMIGRANEDSQRYASIKIEIED